MVEWIRTSAPCPFSPLSFFLAPSLPPSLSPPWMCTPSPLCLCAHTSRVLSVLAVATHLQADEGAVGDAPDEPPRLVEGREEAVLFCVLFFGWWGRGGGCSSCVVKGKMGKGTLHLYKKRRHGVGAIHADPTQQGKLTSLPTATTTGVLTSPRRPFTLAVPACSHLREKPPWDAVECFCERGSGWQPSAPA